MMRPVTYLLTLTLAGCSTVPERSTDTAELVACERREDGTPTHPEQCLDRHRGALSLCGVYHDQARARTEQRSREAELYGWIAAGSSATSVVLIGVISAFAATPADL